MDHPVVLGLPASESGSRPAGAALLVLSLLATSACAPEAAPAPAARFSPVQGAHPIEMPDRGTGYLGVFAGPLGEFGVFEVDLKAEPGTASGEGKTVLAGELRTGDGRRYWPGSGRISPDEFPRLELSAGPYRLGLSDTHTAADAFREVPSGVYAGPGGVGGYSAVRRDGGTSIHCGWTTSREFPVLLVVNSAGQVGGVLGGPRRGEAWKVAGRAVDGVIRAGLLDEDEIVGRIEGGSVTGKADGRDFTASTEDCP